MRSPDDPDTTGTETMTLLIRCQYFWCNRYTHELSVHQKKLIRRSFLECDYYYSNPFVKKKTGRIFSNTTWTTCQSVFCFSTSCCHTDRVFDVRKSTSRSASCGPCGHAQHDLCQAAGSILQLNDGSQCAAELVPSVISGSVVIRTRSACVMTGTHECIQ